jgi:hypothetical protein
MGKGSTVALQIILAHSMLTHPQAKTLITDELHSSDSFINGDVLRFVSIQLVLIDQHSVSLRRWCSSWSWTRPTNILRCRFGHQMMW